MPPVSQTVRVKVLFFGRLKELTGQAEQFAELSSGASIESVFSSFAARYPKLQEYRSSLVASCNREFAGWSTVLHNGDEVAFLPPVSGG
jgi:molybdopterin converting factor subunit 1